MIGVVVAIREELTDFFSENEFVPDKLYSNDQTIYTSALISNVALIESGMGKTNAINATNKLINLLQPGLIISAGFAGSVKRQVMPGTSYLCDNLWSIQGSPAFWSKEIAERTNVMDENRAVNFNKFISDSDLKIQLGSCMTVDQFIYNHDLKTWIGNNFSVDVIDMESYWVSQTAIENNVESAVIRVVLDPMEQKLPPFIVEAANNKRSRTLISGLKHIAANPGDLKKILQISIQVKKSRRILGSTLQALIESDILPMSETVNMA